MNIQEARSIAMSDKKTGEPLETDYCITLAQAWEGEYKNSICLERIFVKEKETVEIRLAWWKDKAFQPRPADLEIELWPKLFAKAVEAKVFDDDDLIDLRKALLI